MRLSWQYSLEAAVETGCGLYIPKTSSTTSTSQADKEAIVQIPIDDMSYKSFLYHPPIYKHLSSITQNSNYIPTYTSSTTNAIKGYPVIKMNSKPRFGTIIQGEKKYLFQKNSLLRKFIQKNDLDENIKDLKGNRPINSNLLHFMNKEETQQEIKKEEFINFDLNQFDDDENKGIYEGLLANQMGFDLSSYQTPSSVIRSSTSNLLKKDQGYYNCSLNYLSGTITSQIISNETNLSQNMMTSNSTTSSNKNRSNSHGMNQLSSNHYHSFNKESKLHGNPSNPSHSSHMESTNLKEETYHKSMKRNIKQSKDISRNHTNASTLLQNLQKSNSLSSEISHRNNIPQDRLPPSKKDYNRYLQITSSLQGRSENHSFHSHLHHSSNVSVSHGSGSSNVPPTNPIGLIHTNPISQSRTKSIYGNSLSHSNIMSAMNSNNSTNSSNKSNNLNPISNLDKEDVSNYNINQTSRLLMKGYKSTMNHQSNNLNASSILNARNNNQSTLSNRNTSNATAVLNAMLASKANSGKTSR